MMHTFNALAAVDAMLVNKCQTYRLNLHLRKKNGITCMYSVGIYRAYVA